MHRSAIRPIGILVSVLATTVALPLFAPAADAEPLPPASRPVHPVYPIPKDETSKQAVLRGCKVFDTCDVDYVRELFVAQGDAESCFVESYCLYAVALTRVELSVRKQFGDKAGDDLVHAAGEQTTADAEAAVEKVEGDRAEVTLRGATGPSILHRIDGVWKVKASDMLVGMKPEEVKGLTDGYIGWFADLNEINHKLVTGGYKSAAEVSAAVKQLVNP